MGGKRGKKRKPKGYWTVERALAEPRKGETISEFNRRAPGAYSVIRKHNLLEKCNLIRKIRPDWTTKTAIIESKKYTTLTEFRKCAPTAYEFLSRHKLINKCRCKRIYKQKGYYTKEKCFELAHGCTTRSEIEKRYPRAYTIICRYNWFPEMTWLEPPKNLHVDGYYIYSYKFPDECIYFGTTIDPKRRHREHATGKTNGKNSRSAVYEHHVKTGLPIPEMEILLENLSANDAVDKENEYVKNARAELGPAKVLNKAKPGSLGGCYRKWNESSIHHLIRSKGYETMIDFRNGSPGAYAAAYRLGLSSEELGLLSLCNEMKPVYAFLAISGELFGRYISESEAAKALNISSKNISRCICHKQRSVGGYVFSINKKCPVLPQQPLRKRLTFNECKKTALKDGSRTAFSRNHIGMYRIAKEQGWLDLIFGEKGKRRFRPIVQIDTKTGKR